MTLTASGGLDGTLLTNILGGMNDAEFLHTAYNQMSNQDDEDDEGGGNGQTNSSDPDWMPDWGDDPNASQTHPPSPGGGNPQPTNDPGREGQPDKPNVDPATPAGGDTPPEDPYDIDWDNLDHSDPPDSNEEIQDWDIGYA